MRINYTKSYGLIIVTFSNDYEIFPKAYTVYSKLDISSALDSTKII